MSEANLQVQSDFLRAMRGLAATVTIISTASSGEKHGMTATAVTSLSMEPPTLLFCVNRSASLHAHLAIGERCCVNLLASDQVAVSQAFAGKVARHERFAVGSWAERDGIPHLIGAKALIFGVIDLIVPYATHSIVIARALAAEVTDAAEPLLYYQGDYGMIAPRTT